MVSSKPIGQLITLVYVSSSVTLLSEQEILNILRVSRANNQRRDITGVLLYEDGNFMQVLEGAEQAVRELAGIIKLDSRHSGYMQLLEKRIDARQFSQWSMGFRRIRELTDQDRNVFISYLEDSSEWVSNRSDGNEGSVRRNTAVHVLLKSFKKSCGFIPEPAY